MGKRQSKPWSQVCSRSLWAALHLTNLVQASAGQRTCCSDCTSHLTSFCSQGTRVLSFIWTWGCCKMDGGGTGPALAQTWFNSMLMLQAWLSLLLPSAKENQQISCISIGSTCPSIRFIFLITFTVGSEKYSDGSNLILADQNREIKWSHRQKILGTGGGLEL